MTTKERIIVFASSKANSIRFEHGGRDAKAYKFQRK